MASKPKSSKSKLKKSWYAVDINASEDSYKRLELSSSSEGSEILRSRGGISNQTFSGINLCEIDSLEDVFNVTHENKIIANYSTSRKSSGQKLGSKSFNGEYNWNQGIDVYQEPEFDDFDPFADDIRGRSQQVNIAEDCRSKNMEKLHSLWKTGESSIQENLLEYESDFENKAKSRFGQRISNNEFLPSTAIRKEPKSGERLSKDMNRSVESYRAMEHIDQDFRHVSDCLKVFDNVNIERITDDESSIDVPYSDDRELTVAEEVLYKDIVDEANIPSEVSGYSFLSDSSGMVSPIIDTESQAAIFDNLSLDENNAVEDENEEEEDEGVADGLISPPISKESASLLAKIASRSQFASRYSNNADPVAIVTRTMNPTNNPNQNNHIEDTVENKRTKEVADSNLKNHSSKSSPKTSKNLIQNYSRNINNNNSNQSLEKETPSTKNSSANLNSAETLNSQFQKNDAKDSGYINTCTKVFHKLFQMHISEVTSNEAAPETDEETPFVIPTSRNSRNSIPMQPKKIHSIQNLPPDESPSPPSHNYHTLVDDELLEYLDQGKPAAPETDYIDRVFVEVLIKSSDTDAKGRVKKRTITLEFPVHKDDAMSAMIIVNNPHLHNSEIQYVNTQSEIVYNLPKDISSNCKHCIGTFKIRCALRIPVSFKLSCVQQLEIMPQIGIILPNQIQNIQVYSSTSPETWIDRLKFEGILLLAAPFVFNKGRSIENTNTADVQEFWKKFCGSRFRFAQTRFISIQVYHPKKIIVKSLGLGGCLWAALRRLNYFAFHPISQPMLSFPSNLHRNKQLSPLGQMVLRRRQSLALEANEQAERVNDCRFSLLSGFLLLLIAYAWYYYNIYLPEVRRISMLPATGYKGWRDNIAKWVNLMWTSRAGKT